MRMSPRWGVPKENELSSLARNEHRHRSKVPVRRLSERMNPARITNGMAPLVGAFSVGMNQWANQGKNAIQNHRKTIVKYRHVLDRKRNGTVKHGAMR